ncbi:MAG: RagB/SusD family nutrient uptake outer membrane protein [Chitinophagaceae bacterium]|nr:RagB/SusD family nutrient uptake outer membrane protein [Chitinophagaceae bacterium]
MKKIIIIVFSFIITIGSGCKKDPLNITPNGRIDLKDIFQDNNQTAAYLNSCYGNLQQYGGNYFFHTMLAGFSDEAHDNDDPTEGVNSTAWYNGALTPTNNPLDAGGWNGNYYGGDWSGIRKCNVFLSNIDGATVTNASDKSRWKAEAKILRAFYYWDLITRYGPMPIENEAFPTNYDYKELKRSTFDSCVQFIVRNCDEAIAEPNMPYRIITGEPDRARFTKAVAYAIKSEALLFNASPLWNPSNDLSKWQAAATAAQQAITDLTTNSNYALFGDYGSYFITTPDLNPDPVDKETILEMKNNTNITQWQFLNGAPSVRAYKAGATPTQELVDAYEMADGSIPITGYSDADHLQPVIDPLSGYDDANPYINRDPRFYATVFYNGGYYGNINGGSYSLQSYVGGADGFLTSDRHYTHNGYYLHKFVNGDLTDQQSSGARTRKFRLAELYLNLAEAENEANGPTMAAYDAVNKIRARPSVHMPALGGLSQEQLRDRIHNERRVEMSFEEARFWDVRRWKILDQTDKLTTGMKWVKNGSALSNTRVVVDRRNSYADKFLIWPIPLSEISVLPEFTQNPGW